MTATEEQREEIAHLLRRAGFGPTRAEIDAAADAGYEATVERLVRPTGPDAGAARTPPPRLAPPVERGDRKDLDARDAYRKQLTQQRAAVLDWWLARMAAAEQPLTETLTFFWHGHFATSAQKVRYPALMLAQNETFRRLGRGDFRELARALVRDPAILIWLDGRKNTRKAPNENLAREYMELFTLGHGAYTEADVKAGARALTGWKVDVGAGTAALRPALHDPGPETILGTTASFGDRSFVDLLVGRPQSAPFVLTRLWQRLAAPDPPSADVLRRLTTAYGPQRDVIAAVRALFLDPAFRGAGARRALVKQPVQWLVGAHRALGVPIAPTPEKGRAPVAGALRALGQVPFLPPSVGGWPSGGAWLSTAATNARLAYARRLAMAVKPDAALERTGSARADAVAARLGLGTLSARTRGVLAATKDPRDAVALALVSPEYLAN